jgi:hypothetical protein
MDLPQDNDIPDIPDIEPETSSKNRYIIMVLAAFIIIGGGFWFTTGIHMGTPAADKDAPVSEDEIAFKDFAENFCVTLRNIRFDNMDQNRNDLALLCSDDVFKSFKSYYEDPTFVATLKKKQLYTYFQKAERSTLVKRVGNTAMVKVFGYTTYKSAITGNENVYDYTFLVQVEKQKDGNFLVTKYARQ